MTTASNGRGSILGVLAPWLAAATLDSWIAFGAFVRPEPWQFALEAFLLAGFGWAQWTFARGWLRSPLLPAVVLVVFASFPHAPLPLRQLVPYLAGLILGGLALVRAATSRTIPPMAGVAAAVVVVLVAHWFDRRSQDSSACCARPAAHPPQIVTRTASDEPPIVVISIDTLRADAAATMESVQRLAERGAYWPRAMSTSSWTLPALGSLQTGLMPSEHGAACLEDSHCQGLSDSVRTLAEDLQAAGWATSAVVANPWAGAGMGFDRGFETFVDPGQPGRRLLVGGVPKGAHGQDDQRSVDEAIRLLEAAPSRGFYLWVHLMGPHMPYLHSSDEKLRSLDPVTLRSSYPSSAKQRLEIREGYDGEVAYTDRQVQRLLDTLEHKGVLSSGVVVLTSDHGEEFWEHGGVEHGHSHHAEVTDVPLILVGPGVEPGERESVASLLDVAPTIRAMAGLPYEGLDLRDEPDPERIAASWGNIVLRLDCSARNHAGHLIARDCLPELTAMRLFDLAEDPRELQPLRPPGTHPLAERVRRTGPPPRSGAGAAASDRLRALGYLQ